MGLAVFFRRHFSIFGNINKPTDLEAPDHGQ